MAWMSLARVVRDVETAWEAEWREAVKAARASAVWWGSDGVGVEVEGAGAGGEGLVAVVVVEVEMGVGAWVVIEIC